MEEINLNEDIIDSDEQIIEINLEDLGTENTVLKNDDQLLENGNKVIAKKGHVERDIHFQKLESQFEGLTQIEKEDKAYQTSKRIKDRNYSELIAIDYDAITSAYKLIQDKRVKSPDLKRVMQSLLSMILELHQFGEEMFNYNNNKYISQVIAEVEISDTEIGEDTGYAAKIAAVQDYVTKNFHTELQEVKRDDNKKMTIKKAIRDFVHANNIRLEGSPSLDHSAEVIVKSILGYDILEEVMTQPTDIPFEDFIEEVRVDDYNDIRIIKGGNEIRTNLSFQTPQHALLFANKLVRDAAGAQVNFSKDKPYARFRIGETTRVSIMRDPIAIRPLGLAPVGSPVVHFVIRRQRADPFTPEFLVAKDSISEYGNEVLKAAVKYGVAGCMYGGTGTGKTAMFTAYAHNVDKTSRLATFAEVDEMQLRVLDRNKLIDKQVGEDEHGYAVIKQFDNPDYLKAKNSAIMWEIPNKNMEIVDGLTGYDGLLNAILTFSPDAIFLQETKGSELVDLMSAAASGHQAWTTIHAKNFRALPKRMVIMAQAKDTGMSEQLIKSQIVDAFPLVVGCRRYKDGSRRISSIAEFKDYNFVTDEFEINEIMSYKVMENIDTDDGIVTLGKYLAHNLPSETLVTEMLENGMRSQEWRAIQSARERSAKAE